jgi:hypothetical protein
MVRPVVVRPRGGFFTDWSLTACPRRSSQPSSDLPPPLDDADDLGHRPTLRCSALNKSCPPTPVLLAGLVRQYTVIHMTADGPSVELSTSTFVATAAPERKPANHALSPALRTTPSMPGRSWFATHSAQDRIDAIVTAPWADAVLAAVVSPAKMAAVIRVAVFNCQSINVSPWRDRLRASRAAGCPQTRAAEQQVCICYRAYRLFTRGATVYA